MRATAIVFALTIGGCALIQDHAADALDTACALGLVQYGAVIAAAELEGVPVETLAEWLCRNPDVYRAWVEAGKLRGGDPRAAAMRAARAKGLVR
jgi:predicted methyltransferase